eukprot:7014436-Prymnesium_polylepis.1
MTREKGWHHPTVSWLSKPVRAHDKGEALARRERCVEAPVVEYFISKDVEVQVGPAALLELLAQPLLAEGTGRCRGILGADE